MVPWPYIWKRGREGANGKRQEWELLSAGESE